MGFVKKATVFSSCKMGLLMAMFDFLEASLRRGAVSQVGLFISGWVPKGTYLVGNITLEFKRLVL
jgi:hypothetical protein